MSEPSDPGPETRPPLEVEVEVDAPPDVVWRALTDAEELRRWFPLDARVTPGEGGRVWISWGPGMEGEAPIHAWDPPRRFGWTEGQEGQPVRIAVDFHLEGRGGRTVVRLVQSGFGASADWDEYYDAVEGGWTYFLFNLRWYLERHRGTPRDLVWVRRPTTLPVPEAWERVLGGGGLGILRDGNAPAAGERYRLALPGEAPLGGEVAYLRAPRNFAGTLPGLDDALLFVEMEAGGERWHCGVWLSTYGLDDERVAGLQRALESAVEAALPDAP